MGLLLTSFLSLLSHDTDRPKVRPRQAIQLSLAQDTTPPSDQTQPSMATTAAEEKRTKQLLEQVCRRCACLV